MASSPKSRSTVWVGCKIPNGYNVSHDELRDVVDAGTGGTRKAWVPTGKRIIFNGSNSSQVIGGYGRTEVDADWFANWLKQSASDEIVTSGLIFAEGTADDMASGAAERREVRTGTEPLDPDKPGRGLEPAPAT